jgi:hypothetical protein
METGKRPLSNRVVRRATRVLDVPACVLPISDLSSDRKPTNEKVADELARLQYPGLAYLTAQKPTENPTALLLHALALDDLDARLVEALPWLLLQFGELDSEYLLKHARARDLQNRLGFVLALARAVAEHNPSYHHRLGELLELERRLERSRLAREDTFGQSRMTERMRTWLRDNRSDAARHWNLLTDLRREHLPYADRHRGALAQLPS